MRALLLVLGLAACAMGQSPRPETVRLGGETLAVVWPNGVTCRASVPLTGGAGRLEGCPHAADWQVRIVKRNYLEPILGAAVSPYAHVTVTEPSGRATHFRTPPLPDHQN